LPTDHVPGGWHRRQAGQWKRLHPGNNGQKEEPQKQEIMSNDLMYLPISIAYGDSIVIAGGSEEGIKKARRLARLTHHVTYIAPNIPEELTTLGIRLVERDFLETDLKGVRLLFICTPSRQRNHDLKRLAAHHGIVTCVCDDPEYCDFISPAILREGPISISVGSDATDVRRSIRIRNRIRQLVEQGLLDLS
jgi:precorrin-2 dehydrogenase/sirohydrochlorin ferrochelatase